jgi:3-hydroxyisobutyrate dehydrogenase
MNNMSKDEVIGFIGLGVMGNSMAGHLQKAGYALNVYNRTKERAQSLIDGGAKWQDSVADVAANSNIIITIVGFPHDVEEVYLGAEGIIANAESGSLLIDMTTSRPNLAKQIADEAAKKDIASVDAPVSGGDIGAKEARLSIMVGSDENAFERAKPVLDLMGKNIVLQGPAGSGQHTKMCNQIAIATLMIGVVEAMEYAKKSGLDPFTVLESIESGAAGSFTLSNVTPRALKDDFAPGFYVKHFIKDMGIALDSASEMNLDLPGLALAKKLYDKLAELGYENDGTQALFRLYNQEEQTIA